MPTCPKKTYKLKWTLPSSRVRNTWAFGHVGHMVFI